MSSPRKAWPLAAILTSALVLVAAIPIFIVASLAVFQYVPQLQREISRQQLVLATAINGQVTRYFGTATRELTTIELLISDMREVSFFNRHLDAFAASSSFYEAIYLTDPSGKVIAIGLPPASQPNRNNFIGQDFSRRPFYLDARKENKMVWSDSFLSTVTGRMAVAVARPVGKNMLIGEIGIHPLPSLAKELAAVSQMTVMMVDRNNQLVAHSSNLFADQQYSMANLPVVVEARNRQTESLYNFELAGERLTGSANTISGPEWLVIVAQSEASAAEPIYALWRRIATGVIVAMIGAAGSALIMARFLSQSFARINDKATAIGVGNYLPKHRETRVAELNLLQENLQRMSDAIREREAAMQQARDDVTRINSTLEERVEERTDELTRANEELVTTLNTLQQTQDELLRSEKLAALGSMVAGIAHELNTPIGNGMMAATTLADHSKQFQKELDSGQLRRRALDEFMRNNHTANSILLRNLQRAAELIASFKQVAIDQTSSQRRTFEVKEIVNEILLSLNPTLKKTPYVVVTDIADNLLLDSYPGPLGQIIVNLINNAILHAFESRDHGTIRIVAKPADHESIKLTISDDGVGVPTENLSRIFDPFFTTKLGQGGSGLGLNIVHNLITGLLGGSVAVVSSKEQGTRFEIQLPRRAPLGITSINA